MARQPSPSILTVERHCETTGFAHGRFSRCSICVSFGVQNSSSPIEECPRSIILDDLTFASTIHRCRRSSKDPWTEATLRSIIIIENNPSRLQNHHKNFKELQLSHFHSYEYVCIFTEDPNSQIGWPSPLCVIAFTVIKWCNMYCRICQCTVMLIFIDFFFVWVLKAIVVCGVRI